MKKITNGERNLIKDLYFLVCDDEEKLKELYKDDELMLEILDEAKRLAKEDNVDLYVSFDKMNKNDTKC